MADLSFRLDLGDLQQAAEQIKGFDDVLKTRAQALAGQAHLHIVEQVQTKLHSRRQMYLEALVRPQEIEPGVFVITLDADAVWIENGMPQHSMVDDLLRRGKNGKAKSGPKTAADGSTFRVIPFEHNKGPTKQTTAEQTLTATIKKELKDLGINYAKKEQNPDGTYKQGLLHSFDSKKGTDIRTPNRPDFAQPTPNMAGNRPLPNDPSLIIRNGRAIVANKGANAAPPNDHGFGRGAIGQPMQGPTGTPLLSGMRIYQNPVYETGPDGKQRPKLNKAGIAEVNRSIVTFRVVSSKQKGKAWIYPGIEGQRFFDDAFSWVKLEWEQKLLPELLKQFNLA